MHLDGAVVPGFEQLPKLDKKKEARSRNSEMIIAARHTMK